MSITSSNTNRNAIKLRVVFLGDQSVGKSSIIDRYTTNRYQQSHNSTVGIDFNVKDINKNGQIYRLQMWDTAGQQRYRSLIPTYLKNAQCVVFVYDITKQSSLQNIKMWQKLFKQHQKAPGILVANKIDLINGRKVNKQIGQQFAKILNLKYIQVSAKNGKKINQLFEQILNIIIQDNKKDQQLIQSTRQKIKDLKIIQQQGIQTIVNQQDKPNKITLKNKALTLAKNISCCNT